MSAQASDSAGSCSVRHRTKISSVRHSSSIASILNFLAGCVSLRGQSMLLEALNHALGQENASVAQV